MIDFGVSLSNITSIISADEPLRWMDQKVTYDNLRVVAAATDSVMGGKESFFNWKTLRDSRSLQSYVERFYGKPGLEVLPAAHEYDKFIGQPLQTLAFAGALESDTVGRERRFRIIDRDLLSSIAQSDEAAFDFLVQYLERTLTDAGWIHHLDLFIDGPQTQSDFRSLKSSFTSFMLDHSRIGSKGSKSPETEIYRIFPKVINPICLDRGAHGSIKGRLSHDIIQMSDLRYNRPNWRDLGANKPRSLTRSEHDLAFLVEPARAGTSLTGVMKKVRQYHNGVSEMPHDSSVRATHIHHMFPKSQFPQLADTRENLIALTPGQHMGEAHPNGNTSIIDSIYRKSCLFQKLESVKRSGEKGDDFYNYSGLSIVLAVGFGETPPYPDYMSLKKAIQTLA
ncbi:hypothetical protein [Corynebacterium variabile]|uniref:hypothetical protein n=1 Tax=Corynebacterium variabile TaxID=1727 RepID=UPI003FD3CD5E